MIDWLTGIPTWTLVVFGVLCLLVAIRGSIQAHQAAQRMREALKVLLADDQVRMDAKVEALRLNTLMHWWPLWHVRLHEEPLPEGTIDRLWETAKADGLISAEGFARIQQIRADEKRTNDTETLG